MLFSALATTLQSLTKCFLAFKVTLVAPDASRSTPSSVLVGGEQSEWASVLRTRGIALSEPRSRNQLIVDIIEALTGQHVPPKRVSNYLMGLETHTLGRLMRVPQKSSDIVSRILRLSSFNPFIMHDALYRMLREETPLLEDDLDAFEAIVSSTTPALRQGVTCLRILYNQKHRSRIVNLIRPEILPNLRFLCIRTASRNIPKEAIRLEETLARSNPKTTVKLVRPHDYKDGNSPH